MGSLRVGVLALQGAFDAHRRILESLGATVIETRTESDLESVGALVLPGGESGTMWMLLERFSLVEKLRSRVADGMPVFGTCAGLILLATEVIDGRTDQKSLGVIDVSVRRNAYGRQVDSFEKKVAGEFGSMRGIFIRAPRIMRVGNGVEVLAADDDEPVLVRCGNVLAATFHPELSGETVLHSFFLEMAQGSGVPETSIAGSILRSA